MPQTDTDYSSLSRGDDLILNDHQDGDIIISNFTRRDVTHNLGGAIRFSTTGDTLKRSNPQPGHHDVERLTVMPDGNIGFALAPDSTGLCTAMDQVQIGGGSMLAGGSMLGGLYLYGGNRFEGMAKSSGGGVFPIDWRGIAFNHYEDHVSGISYRASPTDWSGIGFGNGSGGLINLSCNPWHAGDALTSTYGGVTLALTGTNGLEFYSDDTLLGGLRYKHLFDCWRKGFTGGLGIRNDSGLFFHHTPVYIGGNGDPNFTHLTSVNPAIGDGETWMLAVNGPVLGKEFYVSLDWPDYVFDPEYKLPSLSEVEKFIKENHHLPDIPSANKIVETGVPLGRTEAAITKQMEEMMLYIEQLNHKIDSLESQVEDLKKQGGQ